MLGTFKVLGKSRNMRTKVGIFLLSSSAGEGDIVEDE